MGLAYYIALNRKVRFDTLINGRAFAKEAEGIRRICAKLGIPSAHDFLDMSEEAASYGLDPNLPAQKPKWFSASEGLKWVDALYEHIDEKPKSLKNRAAVLEDLDEYKLVLQNAKKCRARWHLKIDY